MRKEDFVTPLEHQPLVQEIEPLLHGKSPALQSTVLADLLATWLVGIRPDLREELFQRHIELVRQLMKRKPSRWHN